MKKFLCISLMVAVMVVLIVVGRAKAQEVGMPVSMTGFLCGSAKDVETMLDKMEPDLDFDQAKLLAKGTSCEFTEKAGIIKSMDDSFTNKRGDTFAIIAVTAEDKVLWTWRLVKTGTPT